MSWFIWFLLGLLIGALAVWLPLTRMSDRRVAEAEGKNREQLDRAIQDAADADRAHRETKQRLIDLQLGFHKFEERATQITGQRAEWERRAIEAENRLAAAQRELAAVHAVAARERTERAEQSTPNATHQSELSTSQAASTTALSTEPDEVAAPPEPPRAQELTVRPDENRSAVDQPATASEPSPGPSPSPEPVSDASSSENAPPLPPRDSRIKALEARLAMLPAGSSARSGLAAELSQLKAGGQGAASQAPSAVEPPQQTPTAVAPNPKSLPPSSPAQPERHHAGSNKDDFRRRSKGSGKRSGGPPRPGSRG